MVQPLIGFLAFAIGIVAIAVAPVLAVWLIMQVVKGLGFLIRGTFSILGAVIGHLARFVQGTVVDSVQVVGHLLTGAVVALLAVGSLATFSLRRARHYGTAAEDEIMGAIASLYRVGIGHPIRLFGLGALTDGFEKRLPELVAGEPRTAPAHARKSAGEALRRGATPRFDGYDVVRELKPGGSGARLFEAVPRAEHARALSGRGIDVPSRVVVKAFALGYGSTIPQIVRESRSLDAARSLGLVVEHDLTEDAFHYVMPFVPGEDLDVVTRQLHASSKAADGLDDAGLAAVLAYARDLCTQLDRFHGEGLWHKDVKPNNLMISDGRLQVVDFGLVTPLESALTLTTHGTEFFRDPELVRLALEGKRVKDVDGVKFDVYSAGAVLYSMIENSFPAHGSLSSISKRTPEALRWIVRRAMADIDKRYPSAAAFGADLDVLLAAADPFSVRPADLPSVNGRTVAAPRAQRASAEPDDVRAFEGLGLRAEVHGLGRARRSLRARADARRAERRRRAEERASAREARVAAKHEARVERRRRRRGMARAFLTLLVFFGLLGGVATHFAEEASHRRSATGTVADGSVVLVDTDDLHARSGRFRDGPSTSWTLPSSTQLALRGLGEGARVLVAVDPSGPRTVRQAADVLGRSLRALGVEPLATRDAATGQPDADELELLGRALHEVALAGVREADVAQRLEQFAASEDDVDALLWVTEDARTGHLRLQLMLGEPVMETEPGERWLREALGEFDDDRGVRAGEATSCGRVAVGFPR